MCVYIYFTVGLRNFLKNSRSHPKGVIKQDPHSGPTNMRRQRTIFCRPVDLSPVLMYSYVIVTYTFMIFHFRCDLASGPFPSIFPPKILCIYLVYPVPRQHMLTRHMCLKLTILPRISLQQIQH